jgi:type VI secretion system secreted protein VgrG
MGWTGKRNRCTTRLRHRPQLEFLDDRCLLSTSTGTLPTGHAATLVLNARHQVKNARGVPAHAGAANQAVTHQLAKTQDVERPAGSIETGAPTAYDPVIGAAQTRSTFNVDGTGITVAVIDTGVDYNNPALGGGFGPGHKVVAGFDFADNSSDPMATSSQHGTGTAGLIGSNDPNDLGVAPGVDIVALRVTDSTNTGSLTSVANALQWVIDNHEQYNITAVNMSLSDGGNYAQNWFANDGGEGQQITQLIGQLSALNIPVIAAAGNSFTGQQGMGFAAIVAGTISVTATDLSGNLLPNAQRLSSAIGGASATTIAAPGEGLTVPTGDSGTTTVGGTSFATALVTGSVTLLQELYQSRFGTLPTVAQIKNWLQQGATPIQDSVTGIPLGELNVYNSAELIPAPSQSSGSANSGSTARPPTTVSSTSQTNSASSSTASSATGSTTMSTQVTTSPVVTSKSPASTTSTTTTSTPATSTTTTSTTTTSAATSNPAAPTIQVFVNGQAVTGGGSGSSSSTVLSNLPDYQALLQAMNSWGSGGWGGSGQGNVQVQIWNAQP